jgi:hypothetical protein
MFDFLHEKLYFNILQKINTATLNPKSLKDEKVEKMLYVVHFFYFILCEYCECLNFTQLRHIFILNFVFAKSSLSDGC